LSYGRSVFKLLITEMT